MASEVKEAVRAAAREATAELRSTTAELRRLRGAEDEEQQQEERSSSPSPSCRGSGGLGEQIEDNDAEATTPPRRAVREVVSQFERQSLRERSCPNSVVNAAPVAIAHAEL